MFVELTLRERLVVVDAAAASREGGEQHAASRQSGTHGVIVTLIDAWTPSDDSSRVVGSWRDSMRG